MKRFNKSDKLDASLTTLFRHEAKADPERMEQMRRRLLADLPDEAPSEARGTTLWTWLGSLASAAVALSLWIFLWSAPATEDPTSPSALPERLQPLAAYVNDEENLARLENLLVALTDASESQGSLQQADPSYSLDSLSVDEAWSLSMGNYDNDFFL